MEREQWNYKGLKCTIVSSDSGHIYTVEDIGLITKESMTFIYGGSPRNITKKDVEDKINIKLKENKVNILTTCHNAIDAHRKGYCAFEPVCNEKCSLVNWASVAEDLQLEVNNLEERMEEMEDTSQELEDLQDEYSDLEYKSDDQEKTLEAIEDILDKTCSADDKLKLISEAIND